MPKGGLRKFDHDECRALYATGEWTLRQLAERFGVSETRVWQVQDPERMRRETEASMRWNRANYHTTCRECGAKIWKKGNRPNQTGLCTVCFGVTRRTAEHGTESRYSSGCRCLPCRRAAADARRARRHANIEATRAYDRARWHGRKRAAS